jgi:hypothetical protein
VLKGFSSSRRPYSSSRPSLYQRSARRWLRAYSLPNRTVGGSPATVMRRGGGAGRPGQPERLDVLDDQVELILEPAADRLAAGPGDVQVGAPPAAVGDREHLVGGKPTEGQQRDGDTDGHRDQHVRRGLGSQGNPAERRQGNQPGRDPLAGVAPATLGDQRVQDGHQDRREEGDLQRRQRPATPARLDDHPERPRAAHGRSHHVGSEHDHHAHEDKQDDQVPEAPKRQQRQHQPGHQCVEDPPGTEAGQRPPGHPQPRRIEPSQPPHHRVIGDSDGDGGAAHAAAKDHDRQRDQPDRGQQPPDPADLQVTRQRGWLSRRPAAAHRPEHPWLHPRAARLGRLVCGHVHRPPNRGGSARHKDLPCRILACQGSEPLRSAFSKPSLVTSSQLRLCRLPIHHSAALLTFRTLCRPPRHNT